MRLPCLVTRKLSYKFVNTTTGACKTKSKRRADKSNSQSIRKKKILKNFDFSSCRDDDVTRRVTGACVFGLKMIVNNVAVTTVYAKQCVPGMLFSC